MKLIYRISDGSYKKPKLIGATKESCLNNFLSVFKENLFFENKPQILIIADGCGEKTKDIICKTNLPIVFSNLGNAGSLIYSIKKSIEEFEDNEIIYFCEDDYLHLPISPQLIEEGIKRSDYVSLYDHPDKYTFQYNGGEFSKVIKTTSSHWRFTVSTCMTFASTAGVLKKDLNIWEKYTKENHPHDHHIFTDLGKENKRRLAVCIPGCACHTDLEYSNRVQRVLIEPWAISMMIKEVKNKINSSLNDSKNPKINVFGFLDFEQFLASDWFCSKNDWEKLTTLDAILQNQNISE